MYGGDRETRPGRNVNSGEDRAGLPFGLQYPLPVAL
jgi:hypothetical protein